MKNRSYRELSRLETFEERFEYLRLNGEVGRDTFGFDRYLNQQFYTSTEWRNQRHFVIARDLGRDLGVEDHEIFDRVFVHHINPITPEDFIEGSDRLLDLDNLITVSNETHNAIHYGDKSSLRQELIERRPGDTTPWR